MKCGARNPHFSLEGLSKEYACSSLEEAHTKKCHDYHKPDGPLQADWKFCPFCGCDVIALFLESLG
jgi:hypothetical protein